MVRVVPEETYDAGLVDATGEMGKGDAESGESLYEGVVPIEEKEELWE